MIGDADRNGVTVERITYPARNIGTTIVANLVEAPAEPQVCGYRGDPPIRRVKKRTACLYAQRLAEQGFIGAYDAVVPMRVS